VKGTGKKKVIAEKRDQIMAQKRKSWTNREKCKKAGKGADLKGRKNSHEQGKRTLDIERLRISSSSKRRRG